MTPWPERDPQHHSDSLVRSLEHDDRPPGFADLLCTLGLVIVPARPAGMWLAMGL